MTTNPENQTQQPPDDPDAQGLPPGVVLPDATEYKLTQLRAQLISYVGMVLFILLWTLFVLQGKREVGFTCAAIASSGIIVNLIRIYFVRRAQRKNQPPAP